MSIFQTVVHCKIEESLALAEENNANNTILAKKKGQVGDDNGCFLWVFWWLLYNHVGAHDSGGGYGCSIPMVVLRMVMVVLVP